MPLLNNVGSNVRRSGQSQLATKKIYHGTDVVYENAHLPVTGNLISRPFFDGDGRYPGAIARSVAEQQWSAWYTTGIYTDGWGHYNGFFTNVFDYQAYIGRYWLYPFETNQKSTGSEPYIDMASTSIAGGGYTFTGTGTNGGRISGTGRIGTVPIKRVLKLHGGGTSFNSVNRDPDRVPAVVTICTTADNSVVGGQSWFVQQNKRWNQDLYATQVDIPDDATSVTFGAYVRCPRDDKFHTYNFGGISAVFVNGNGETSTESIVSTILFSEPIDTIPTLFSGTSSDINVAPYQWGGINTLANVQAGFSTDRNSASVNINTHVVEDASDYAEFKYVSRTITGDFINSGETNRKMLLQLGFFENHANMLTGSSPTPSGSIWFYNPVVTYGTG